jgi:hypothetical protein
MFQITLKTKLLLARLELLFVLDVQMIVPQDLDNMILPSSVVQLAGMNFR